MDRAIKELKKRSIDDGLHQLLNRRSDHWFLGGLFSPTHFHEESDFA